MSNKSKKANERRGGILGWLSWAIVGLFTLLSLRQLLSDGRSKLDTPRTRQAPPEPAEYEEDVVGRPVQLPDPEDIAAGIELEDANLGGIVRAGVWMLVLGVVVLVIATGLQWALTGQLDDLSPPEGAVADPPSSEVPYLIETRALTGVEYEAYREEEDAQLSGYGWVDEGASTVHIPIDRAMELLLEEGFPARAESDMDMLGETGLEQPSDSSSGRMMERTREWLNAESPK